MYYIFALATLVTCATLSNCREIFPTPMDQLKQVYVRMILECSKNFQITADDMEKVRNKIMPDSNEVKCLFACAYKKSGLMNDKGELYEEGIRATSQKYFYNDPDKLDKTEAFIETCKTVNKIPVSDGEKGCERAALIFDCTLHKSLEFDLV